MRRHTKHNDTAFSDALLREAEGLALLREALELGGDSGLRVPVVESVDASTLTIQAIESRPSDERQMRMLGQGLAVLHKQPARHYGFHEDNYIGLSPQPNRTTGDWGQFFVRDRLGYQVSRIGDSRVCSRFASILETRGEALADWLNEHCDGPSLIHGDLWQGNVLFDGEHPWLIDPAVYYGDREADLAMTEMFGGFSGAFYQAYDEAIGISDAYPTKRTIYNLYHYLNHYNLFGGGYLGGCERGFEVLKRF